jgi:hypothetical protein
MDGTSSAHVRGEKYVPNCLKKGENIKMDLREAGCVGACIWLKDRVQCEYSNELSVSMRSVEFLDQLNNYQPLRKDYKFRNVMHIKLVTDICNGQR